MRSAAGARLDKSLYSGLKQGRPIAGQLRRLSISLRLGFSFHERRVFGGFLKILPASCFSQSPPGQRPSRFKRSAPGARLDKSLYSGLKQGRPIAGQLRRFYVSLRLNSSFHERRTIGGFLETSAPPRPCEAFAFFPEAAIMPRECLSRRRFHSKPASARESSPLHLLSNP
jgi:hypothetical protein